MRLEHIQHHQMPRLQRRQAFSRGSIHVDRSNWSKFVDGKPVRDAHGKVAKGQYYSKPNLKGLFLC